MKFVTVAEMQAIEKEANASGLTYEQMMEHAGGGLAEAVAQTFPEEKANGVLGLVGSGNNGGDTLVALAALAQAGWMASAYLARSRPAEDPLLARLSEAGGKLYRLEEDKNKEMLGELLHNHAVVLDGILGTGMRLPLKGEVAKVLGFARKVIATDPTPPHVVAVDCPSGVDCDSGEAAPECLRADLTVTMAAVKQGLLKFPAFEYVGGLQVVGIGLPEDGGELEAWHAVRRIVPSRSRVRQMLPDRPANSHKGTFGTALVVAGSMNYTGAALLAGEAAYRIGAGLVTIGVPVPLHVALAGHLPEATWVLLPHEMGVVAPEAVEVLQDSLKRATALLVGPGLGMEKKTGEFIARLIGATARASRPGIGFARPQAITDNETVELPALVVDADGLKLLAEIPDWYQHLPAMTVLTPHPGEMSVLTGLSKDDIQTDRLGIATQFSAQWGHVVVLKGAFTIVAAPDGQAAVIPVATSALARAGTGDVLAGLITGLRAQGVAAFPAAVAGAWVHAQAGLKAAELLGAEASVLAGDVLRSVNEVLAELLVEG